MSTYLALVAWLPTVAPFGAHLRLRLYMAWFVPAYYYGQRFWLRLERLLHRLRLRRSTANVTQGKRRQTLSKPKQTGLWLLRKGQRSRM